MISTFSETKKINFGEQKQMYVKDGGDEWKFVFMENNIVSLIKMKIIFELFQFSFGKYQCANILKFKLAYIRGFFWGWHQSRKIGIIKERRQGIENR